MLPALRTITILVHLGGFGLCKAEGQPGIWWWSLGDWEFFSAPSGPDMGKLLKGGLFTGIKAPGCFLTAACPGLRPYWVWSGAGSRYSVSTKATAGLSGF